MSAHPRGHRSHVSSPQRYAAQIKDKLVAQAKRLEKHMATDVLREMVELALLVPATAPTIMYGTIQMVRVDHAVDVCLALIEAERATIHKFAKEMADCPNGMCGHCIEVLCEEIMERCAPLPGDSTRGDGK